MRLSPGRPPVIQPVLFLTRLGYPHFLHTSSAQALQYASSLYPQTPPWCLDWAHRLPLMMREVAHWRPDVVCMQVWGMNGGKCV